MLPVRPYIFKAYLDWIIDNKHTPYLLVNSHNKALQVPGHIVNGPQIVLNISANAVTNFSQQEDAISFKATFNGKSFELYVPFSAMIAIYSREIEDGIVFEEEDCYLIKENNEVMLSPEELKVNSDSKGINNNSEKTNKPSYLNIVK